MGQQSTIHMWNMIVNETVREPNCHMYSTHMYILYTGILGWAKRFGTSKTGEGKKDIKSWFHQQGLSFSPGQKKTTQSKSINQISI